MVDEVPGILRQLWRDRIGALATQVANKTREYRELRHAATLIQDDYRGRFLIELIQNASDQARRGETRNAHIVVVRTENLLAVSNEGQEMTHENLARISALADSDKSGVLIGNKGVGFKSVYQVTDAPELYSTRDRRKTAHVFNATQLDGFAFEKNPFQNGVLLKALEEDLKEFFRKNRGLANECRKHSEHPTDKVLAVLGQVDGFRYPLPRSRTDLSKRLDVLRFPTEEQRHVRTLVVLPLRDRNAGLVVEEAIDQLARHGEDGQPSQAELSVLFLPGVAELSIVDHVRNKNWRFKYSERDPENGMKTGSVTIEQGSSRATSQYWIQERDVLACNSREMTRRLKVVNEARSRLDLTLWKPGDPLTVTVALPNTRGQNLTRRHSGRFCMGLPTDQRTGLPAHVDAAFFGKIDRTSIPFDQSSAYNRLLLTVAADTYGEMLHSLRRSQRLDHRRMATLALERYQPTGDALAREVYREGGVADGKVVLGWNGRSFLRRKECRLPDSRERNLLRSMEGALDSGTGGLRSLPEQHLLENALDVLGTIDLPKLAELKPHPWLARNHGGVSPIERAARSHRGDGAKWWEPFVGALVGDLFAPADLLNQTWLPIGHSSLAKPADRVFLPMGPARQSDDDEDLVQIPDNVAAELRVADSRALRLRDAKGALNPLAQRLSDLHFVHRPRKLDLLQHALFPALSRTAGENEELALALFAQAIVWVSSMNPATTKQLDCSKVLVPVGQEAGGIRWCKPDLTYLGPGWVHDQVHENLLARSYPDNRLVPRESIERRFSHGHRDLGKWSHAVSVLGVHDSPRIMALKRGNEYPLSGHRRKLSIVGTPQLERSDLNEHYGDYLDYLCTFPTQWERPFPHDVSSVKWIDGLESPERQSHVLELMLRRWEKYLEHSHTSLIRVDHDSIRTDIQQFWVHAITKGDWCIFPAEEGVGGGRLTVPASQLWNLSDAFRTKHMAKVVYAVPHWQSGASEFLERLNVWSIEKAPAPRLFSGLTQLARHIQRDPQTVSRNSSSLAMVLYSELERRLENRGTVLNVDPDSDVALPLLSSEFRLVAVPVSDPQAVVLFDDDPLRTRHLTAARSAYRVPLSSEGKMERLYQMFRKMWGEPRVIRSSEARLDLQFTPNANSPELFIDWLRTTYPHTEVAVHLAALLDLDRPQSEQSDSEPPGWSPLRRTKLQFGLFRGTTHSFYDRSTEMLQLTNGLRANAVVEATWQVVGTNRRDLWTAYTAALGRLDVEPHSVRAFLEERGVRETQLIRIADTIRLPTDLGIGVLQCALQATYRHLVAGQTLDSAADWWTRVEKNPNSVAASLDRPEWGSVLTKAMGMSFPAGDLHVLRCVGAPVPLWQEAVERRDGARYRFELSVSRFRQVQRHLFAVVREVASRDRRTDLISLSEALSRIEGQEPPGAVTCLPPDEAPTDFEALNRMIRSLSGFAPVVKALRALPRTPWNAELPVPKTAVKRNITVFKNREAIETREQDASRSVQAVIEVATRLSQEYREKVDNQALDADPRLSLLKTGEWANAYAALLALQFVLRRTAPRTVRRLNQVGAFRNPATQEALLRDLPELPPASSPQSSQTKHLLGLEVPTQDLQQSLNTLANGEVEKKLREAAEAEPDFQAMASRREALKHRDRPAAAGSSGSHRSRGTMSKPQRESELVGLLGEAYVHEWLSIRLQDGYTPDCWRSKARNRYGIPGDGNDSLGYDFEVSDPLGQLFGRKVIRLLIEVKATSTDGSGPFLISGAEWGKATECYRMSENCLYVIVRVFQADTTPRIGDVLLDPVAMEHRSELRLTSRDMWISVSPPPKVSDSTNEESDD
jgi:hypothetical protein